MNILDCLRGLFIGVKINRWFVSKTASQASKIYDMDWIAPNKLLALRDPTIRRESRRRGVSKVAVRELKRCGVTAIVRLNGQDHNHCLEYYGYSYEVEEMKREQFVHYEIPFEDVNIPTLHQVNSVRKILYFLFFFFPFIEIFFFHFTRRFFWSIWQNIFGMSFSNKIVYYFKKSFSLIFEYLEAY